MNVLLVKTSSIGDLIHTMPAITDAVTHLPSLKFDWLVEKDLAPVCRWHPAIEDVITVAYRYWRKHPLKGIFGGHLSQFRDQLRSKHYDLVLDAQGLYKSAVMTALSVGHAKHGFDLASCREKLAPLAYDFRHRVSRRDHAVDRLRQLFALAFGYAVPTTPPDFGVDAGRFLRPDLEGRYILCLHGSKWRTKHWPLERWRGLVELAGRSGLKVCLPWLGPPDRHRAMLIAGGLPNAVATQTDLEQIGRLIAHSECVVTIETGLGHLSIAMGTPTVTLYGPTSPDFHGLAGNSSSRCVAGLPCSPCYNKLCNLSLNARSPSPCMEEIHEGDVWQKVVRSIAARTEAVSTETDPGLDSSPK